MFKKFTLFIIFIIINLAGQVKMIKNKNYDIEKKIFLTKNEKNIAVEQENLIVQNEINKVQNKKQHKKKRIAVVPKNKISPDLEVAKKQPFRIEKKNGQIKFNYLII